MCMCIVRDCFSFPNVCKKHGSRCTRELTLMMSVVGVSRICTTRAQQQAKPGRQIITFMLFANITLWVLDTFMTHRDITQGVQTQFFGLLAWGIISRISLPLLIFYRFHSCVVLVEVRDQIF